MTKDSKLVIELLNEHHNRKDFHCTTEALDRYIRTQAQQDIKRRISRIFVATEPDSPTIIQGYYSLSALSIELNQLPESLARRLPKHPIPAALLGRLAVNQTAQGNGVGKMLVVDAFQCWQRQ